jgi:hypothetical protein
MELNPKDRRIHFAGPGIPDVQSWGSKVGMRFREAKLPVSGICIPVRR